MLSRTSNQWFICPQPNSGAETRLFLFPYAGGGPPAFGKWPAALPFTVESWIAHYPGRGSRYQEPPLKELVALAERLAQAIQPVLDQPFAFFGHSMGALLAFELARQLQRQNLPQPDILFLSACGAPAIPDPRRAIHALPDAEFLVALQDFNGIPAEVVDSPELMELLLPALRADFEALEMYRYRASEPALDCRIVALGGLEDPGLDRERLEAWQQHSNAGFKALFFPGDHFFIHTAREAVVASVAAELSALYAKN